MSDRGRNKKEYTPFIISLLKNTTLSYPKISECVERVFNVSLSRQSIYNYKNRYNIERPSENLLEPKDITEGAKKASAKTIKKSEISNEKDNFVPIESIKQVLKVAKIQYKNKSLNENFQNHFNQVERWLNEVAK